LKVPSHCTTAKDRKGPRTSREGTRRQGRAGLWTSRGRSAIRTEAQRWSRMGPWPCGGQAQMRGGHRRRFAWDPRCRHEEFSRLPLLPSLFSVSLTIKQDWAGFATRFPPDSCPSLDFSHDFHPPLNFLLPRSISHALPMYGARLSMAARRCLWTPRQMSCT